jgi:phosphorylcholine metabolism protein LicD
MQVQEKAAIDNLKEVKEVFDRRGIKHWLDWGTLLGAVRDGKLIKWERDLDLGTKEKWGKIVSAVQELKKQGFEVFLEEIKLDEALFERRMHLQKSGAVIDIVPYEVEEDHATWIMIESRNRNSQILKVLYHVLESQKMFVESSRGRLFVGIVRLGLLVLPPPLKKRLSRVVWRAWSKSKIRYLLIRVPKRYFEKLKTMDFYGMKVTAPADAEGYLEYRYGQDWKKPRKEWDWQKEDGTVQEVLTK